MVGRTERCKDSCLKDYMAHLIFDSPYEFYKLPEEERVKLIGRIYKERQWVLKGKKKQVTYTDKVRDNLYIPIGLHPDEFNYGIQQGVLRVSPILKDNNGKWWRISAFSPDDLDCDLDFSQEYTGLRQDVIDFVRGPMHKFNRRYKEVLKQIQKHFKAGELT